MSVELGAAYISLAASTKGFSRDVKRALGDVEGEAGRTGKSAGRSLGSGLGKGLKIATGAAAGMAAVIGGIALKGGFSRALNIEDAQAKLSGLGHDTESIQGIMDSALASVKGTAAGLGDAAAVAASTVAAGVKPGADLTRTLKLVNDAATIAGTGMGDMGAIFNKVAGTGKVQGEVIAQLGERGIPILQLLADELGVTAGEVADLASKGKIDFATFQDAMEAGMGGAALKSGDTFRGSLANVMAALGRLGEKAASPILSSLKGVFNDAIPAIDSVTTAVAPLAAGLADKIAPAVETVSKKFFGWITRMAAGEGEMSGLMTLLRPLGAALQGLMPALAALGTEIGALASQLGAALAPLLPVIVNALVAILTAVTPLLPVIGEALTAVIAAVTPIISALATTLQTVLEALLPLLPPIIELAASALPILADIVTAVLEALAPLIPVIAEVALALMPALAEIVTAVLEALVPLLPTVLEIVEAFLPLVPLLADLALQMLPLVQQNLEILLPIITGVIGVLAFLVGGFLKVQGAIAGVVLPALGSVIKWLGSVVGAVVKFVTTWAGKLGEFASNTGKAVGDAVKWFTDLPGKIGAIFSNAGSWLLDAGGKIISGLVDGLKGGFDWVKKELGKLTNLLPDWKGPAARDKKILAPAGRLLMKGLAKGITDSRDLVKKALGSITDGLADMQARAIKAGATKIVAATKAAQKLIAAQTKTTKGIWSKGGSAGLDSLLGGFTARGNARKGKKGKAARDATLADIAKGREIIADRLDAANDRLAKMQDAYDSMKSGIASSIRGELDLTAGIGEDTTTEWGHTVKGKTTFASVAGQVKAMATKAKAFAQKLQALVRKGIPAGLVQEVAGLGTENGIKVADALLSGSASEVKALQSDYASLESWSSKAGEYVAEQMYGAGIEAQKGIIAGLESDDKKLEAAAKKLADKLAKAVKRALGIKSPSRLFRDEVGLMLSAGVVAGLDKGQPALDRRVGDLARPSMPSLEGKFINPEATKGSQASGGEVRALTDADIEALAWALSKVQVKAAYDNRTAADVSRRGIQEIRRTDPAVLTGVGR